MALDELIERDRGEPDAARPEDFYDACWAEVLYEGKPYAVPINTDDRGLYYHEEEADTRVLRRVMVDRNASVANHVTRAEVPRLPDTGQFAQGIVERYGRSATALTGTQASESQLLAEPMDRYGLGVLFAAHGIVDERTLDVQQAALLVSKPSATGEPLRVTMGREGAEREIDGYLPADEIMDRPIPTELAAAPACRTGEGGIVAGGGVMNLGRALQYAGAHSVLLSLWSVAGESTNLMMDRMLDGMRTGESNGRALLAARNRLRQAGHERPFY